MKEEGSREIEQDVCMYINAGIGMQFNRILKISRTSSLTGSPTDGTILTKTTKPVRCEAMQRT